MAVCCVGRGPTYEPRASGPSAKRLKSLPGTLIGLIGTFAALGAWWQTRGPT